MWHGQESLPPHHLGCGLCSLAWHQQTPSQSLWNMSFWMLRTEIYQMISGCFLFRAILEKVNKNSCKALKDIRARLDQNPQLTTSRGTPHAPGTTYGTPYFIGYENHHGPTIHIMVLRYTIHSMLSLMNNGKTRHAHAWILSPLEVKVMRRSRTSNSLHDCISVQLVQM